MVRTIVYGGWLVSVILHEFNHSLTAYLGGDREIRARGYLTLNPFRFMDPIYSFAIPVLITMWGGIPLMGGRTLVDHRALRSRWWETGVSLAGPATNLAIAGLIASAFALGLLETGTAVAAGFAFLAVLQVSAALFNLIPFPPFDGFGALAPHLPEEWVRRLAPIGRSGYLLVILAFWTLPGLSAQFWDQAYTIVGHFHIPYFDVWYGWHWAHFR